MTTDPTDPTHPTDPTDPTDDGIEVVATHEGFATLGTVGGPVTGAADLRVGLSALRDGAADLLVMSPVETVGAQLRVGGVARVDVYELEVVRIDADGAGFVVREFAERPGRPATIPRPGGSREMAGDTRIQIDEDDARPGRFTIVVTTFDDQADAEASVGETVRILDHDVRLVEVTDTAVEIEVLRPDGTALFPVGGG